MARKIRIEYAGAVYHVMARGNQGRSIFVDDLDRKLWLDISAEACLPGPTALTFGRLCPNVKILAANNQFTRLPGPTPLRPRDCSRGGGRRRRGGTSKYDKAVPGLSSTRGFPAAQPRAPRSIASWQRRPCASQVRNVNLLSARRQDTESTPRSTHKVLEPGGCPNNRFGETLLANLRLRRVSLP